MTEQNFRTYPKIKPLGYDENKGILEGHIVVEEKIDGGNFRFMVMGDRIIFGSRTQSLGDEE